MFYFFFRTTFVLILVRMLKTRQRVSFDNVSCEYEFLYYSNDGIFLKTFVKCKSSEILMFVMPIQETVC